MAVVSLVKRAVCAASVGSCWFSGAAPGVGGFRLKLGGMIRGALVTTANSSGDCLVRPAASRRLWQADSETTAKPAKAKGRMRILFAPSGRRVRLDHFIDDEHGAQGNGDVRDIE